jgi:hypothetical protein
MNFSWIKYNRIERKAMLPIIYQMKEGKLSNIDK